MFALQEAVWQSTVQILDFPNGSRSILVELHHRKLLGRVTEAEYAIFERLQSLEGTPNCQSRFVELLAIEDALASLRLLKREQVGLPSEHS